MKKIVIDSNIPYIKGVLEPYFDVKYCSGGSFKDEIENSSALIVRTRTKCNKELLENSSVETIATATIGFDHIDTTYCQENNINVTTAAGCNASAVVQYVLATASALGLEPTVTKLAIVGCGNVGGRLAKTAKILGFNVVCYDPPLADKNNDTMDYLSLEDAISDADLVTVHVPLNREGKYKTYGMVDNHFLTLMKDGATFINSSRGEVVCEDALILAIKSGKIANCVIDVWCNEPAINQELLKLCRFATPHIAGYSRLGKERATEMSVRSIAKHFGIKALENWQLSTPVTAPASMDWSFITSNIKKYFDIEQQTITLKKNSQNFEEMRSNYNYRDEFF